MTSKKMISRSQTLAHNYKLSHKLINKQPEEPKTPIIPYNDEKIFNQNSNSSISGKEKLSDLSKSRSQIIIPNNNSPKINKNSLIENPNTNQEITFNNTETPIINYTNSPIDFKRQSGASLLKFSTPKVSFKEYGNRSKNRLKTLKSVVFPPVVNKGKSGERFSINFAAKKKARLSKSFFNFNLDKRVSILEKEKSTVGMLVGNLTNNFSNRMSLMTMVTNGDDDKNLNMQYNFNRIKTKVFDEKQLKKINAKFMNINHNANDNKEISEMENIHNKIIKFHLALAIFCFISIFCACYDLEIYINKSWLFLKEKYFKNQNKITITEISIFKDMENRNLTFSENFLRILNLIFSLLALITYISGIIYKKKLIKGYSPIKNSKNIETELSIIDLENAKKNKLLIFIEGFIIILFYPPYINKVICKRKDKFVYAYPLNTIFYFFNCFKIFHIFTFYKKFIKYNSFYGQKICHQRGIKLSNSFIIKASYSRYPLAFSIILVIATAALGAFFLHGIESFASDIVFGIDDYTNENGLTYYMDNLVAISWLILKKYTCSLIPMTILGKIVLYILGFIGSGFIFFLMNHLNNMLHLNVHEKKAYSKLEKLFDPENKMHKAADLIRITLVKKRLLIIFETKKLKEKDMNNENKYLNFVYERNMFYIHKFILTVKTNMYSKLFIDDYKVAKNFSLPLDDILISFKDRMIENEEHEEEIIDDFEFCGGLKPILEGMEENEKYFINRIIYCNKIQNQVNDYLIEFYGELFNDQKSKKNIFKVEKKN